MQGLLLEDKAYVAKGRMVYCLSAGSHNQQHDSGVQSSATATARGNSEGTSSAIDGDFDEEQVWLVPVKTSRHIHAVLHIRVSVHKDRTRQIDTGGDALGDNLSVDEENDADGDKDKKSQPSAVPPPSPVYLPHHIVNEADTVSTGLESRAPGQNGQVRIRFTP